MQKVVERPIGLRRVTFANVPTPLDGPTQHMRSASRSAKPLNMEGAVSAENPSSMATTNPASSADQSSKVQSTTTPKPARPVVPRQSE
jgi:hypothetical protein